MPDYSVDQARADIERDISGPSVAAFFDLDGTIVDGVTALAFLQYRLVHRDIDLGEVAQTLRSGIEGLFGRVGFEEFLEDTGTAFRGRPLHEVDTIGREVFERQVKSWIRESIRSLVEQHQQKGHTVVLATSATSFQVEPVAEELGIQHVLCNRMTVDEHGLLTGRFVSPVIWGDGKARAVEAFSEAHGIALGSCYFYADGNEDLTLMRLVGKPRPVHPARRMESVARRQGWPVLRDSGASGKSRPGLSPAQIGKLRNIAGIAALAPAAAVAAGVGLVRQDRRAAFNTMVPLWLGTLFRVNGVEINVVAGERFLKSERPAVFLFNHQNNWDAFITFYLVGTDVTGVAKKEIENDPIAGPLGRLMDVAFIDRADSASSVAALKPIEELARKGLSVVMAPEGTRSPDGSLQPFKKGPFRIAMAAGIPIIPIVIRNALDIGERESASLRPGKVDVAVLEPISVADWSLEKLPEHIASVRNRFLDTLSDWPG